MKNIDGITDIDKVVAEFDVWLDPKLFPFPKMKVKVKQRSHDFAAFSNLSRCDRSTGVPDGIAGLGSTADEALRDLLKRFVSDAQECSPPEGLAEDDFTWSSHEDF